MSLGYVVDEEQQLVVISGEYADAEAWRQLLAGLSCDPRVRPGCAYIRDLRSATEPVTPAMVVQIIAAVRAAWDRLQPTRIAMVTPREFDPAVLVAHALADSEGLPMRMFTSYDAAVDWVTRAGAG